MVHDGLWDVYENFHMGITGDVIAEKYGITREEMDRFALDSHRKAARAIKGGEFKEEIVPVPLAGRGDEVFDTDEGVRSDTSLEKLSRLPPVFPGGRWVTAGNASQLSDGAAAAVVMAADRAKAMGLRPMARIVGHATGGVAPRYVMEAPIPTVHRLLQKVGWTMQDLDLVEHNEAYASASVAIMRALEIPGEKFNVRGGAVALGHPLGCSGARILTTLLHALEDMGKRRGLATLCLGGGNAMALAVERP
jgi:acetyl-CoA C-acetyltransferase